METLMRHPWVNDNCPMLEPYKRKTDTFNEMDLDSVALEVSTIPKSSNLTVILLSWSLWNLTGPLTYWVPSLTLSVISENVSTKWLQFSKHVTQALVNMGIDYNDTINSLRGKKPTKYAATYYLLLEKLSTPRKSSLPLITDSRRKSVDPTALQKAAEKNRWDWLDSGNLILSKRQSWKMVFNPKTRSLPINSITSFRNMLSPINKRKMKKSPHLTLPVSDEGIQAPKSDIQLPSPEVRIFIE